MLLSARRWGSSSLFPLKNWKLGSGFRHFARQALNPEKQRPRHDRIVDLDAVASKYSVGQKLSGFVVRRVEPIPELCLVAIRLSHSKTGASHLHVARNDANNVFSVNLRTTPTDSTGVPHILEHMTLCGSRQFPVRDPFFKMLNRSLATFMNAMTGSDVTLYPFSTQNPTDYRNLMEVYLDAVFHPKLEESDFLQEGWRIEPVDLRDPRSEWVFKGVVFNEMKGVFANPQYILGSRLQNEVFPSHTYAHVSGGEPLVIPNLTWENLRKFHARHYHPSNCRIYTYGDLPLESHLEYIDSKLSEFDAIDPKTEVPLEKKWDKPRRIEVRCQPESMCPDPEKQNTVAVSYLLDSIKDPYSSLCLQLVSDLLLSGPNSPFYKSLLEKKLGSTLSPVSGFDGSTVQSSFTVGLQGVADKDVDHVCETVDETLENATFPKERIEALLHTIELGLKHQTANFGLGLIMNLTAAWNHVEDPIDHLKVNSMLSKFRESYKKDSAFLDKLVERYFVENPHKLTAVLRPDPAFTAEQEAKEKQLLKEKVSKLSDEDKESWARKCAKLAEEQSTKEDVSCLPILKISEIEPRATVHEIIRSDVDGVEFQFSPQPTNGVTYFNAVIDTSMLPENLKPYLPLFCSVLAKMGAADLDYKRLDQMIELRTGGLGAGPHIEVSPLDGKNVEEGISISSHCLNKNTASMFRLWMKIFNELRTDNGERFETLVQMKLSNAINGVPGAGHAYAMRSAGRGLTAAAALTEKMNGFEYLQLLKETVEGEAEGGGGGGKGKGKLAVALENVREIASLVLNKRRMRCAINDTIDNMEDALKSAEIFVSAIGGKPVKAESRFTKRSFIPVTKRTHLIFPFPVSFTSLCFPTPAYVKDHYAALRIASKLLTSKFLLGEVREKGGAYGAGASIQPSGAFSFYSYRDPKGADTFEAYRRAVDWALRSDSFGPDEVHEAKLGVFLAEDAPISPGNRGLEEFLTGISADMKTRHRENLLSVEPKDVRAAVEKYLRDAYVSGACLIGPETAEGKGLSADEGWIKIKAG